MAFVVSPHLRAVAACCSAFPFTGTCFQGARLMAGSGGRGLHGSGRFLQRLRMRRALGIQSKGLLRSFKPMRGRDRRRGTWWDKKLNCIAIGGQDFAQDTQEGGADRFELIPDSDEEGPQQVSSFVAEDDEFVPETEPQDMPVVKLIGNTMFHEWRKVSLESDKACTSQIGTSKENTCTRYIASIKENDDKDDTKDDNEHKASFSDIEPDNEATPINVWKARGKEN
ncbi:unnamed protein product [Miscanthus lutarioriparius]|uniref:Uncharacterized protein n=1 Tax=Miscanthus lutarioriparius TaxID=422564 RepID=A0A811NJL8_9POAL|nr:unnamed protein product [Miscanthus lutarioriparius]